MVEISWSEVKTFQRCPKQHEYKYVQGLVPKKKSRPLYVGNWIHRALETYLKQGDWRIGYREYLADYDKLFDEEKAELDKKGRLPDLIKRVIQSYLWYYRSDGWRTVMVERKFKTPPIKYRGLKVVIKGIIDLVVEVEDENGEIWVVDHKTASQIPDPNSFHAMDPQLMIYPWAVKVVPELKKELNGRIPRGVVYDYIQSKPPSIPQMTPKTGKISRRKIKTDYPTLAKFLRENGEDLEDWVHILRPLRRQSPFLRRYKLPREDKVTQEVLRDVLEVAYHIATDERRSRTITRECRTMCPYHDLCRNELNGFDTALQRTTQFTIREEDEKEEFVTEPEDGEDNG